MKPPSRRDGLLAVRMMATGPSFARVVVDVVGAMGPSPWRAALGCFACSGTLAASAQSLMPPADDVDSERVS